MLSRFVLILALANVCKVADASALEAAAVEPGRVSTVLPFHLDEPYVNVQNQDAEAVGSGAVVVVALPDGKRGDRDRLLFCNTMIVEPLNYARSSRTIVALIPGESLEGTGLESAVLWFGPQAFAEEFSREDVLGAWEAAQALPRSRISLTNLVQEGGATIATSSARFANKRELLRYAADLIDRHAPEDVGIADSFRIPVENTIDLIW
jgi:hypothetical protein